MPKSLEGARLTLHVLAYGRYELTDSFGQQVLTGVAGQEAHGNDVTLFVKTLVARPGTEFYVTREKGRDTGVVQLSYMGTDPHAITAITNAVAASYLAQRTERAQEEASHMLSFLNSELPRLRAEVKRGERHECL